MGSFQNPIGPPDPYEGYKVEGVEEDHHKNEEEKKEQPTSNLQAAGGFLLLAMSKFLSLFEPKGHRGVPLSEENQTRENLLMLRAAFQILTIEDRSQDMELLNRISELWHALVEESHSFSRSDPFTLQFETFTTDLQNYPEGEEHTLGYYLIHHAGNRWLPFPYMDLIRKIHLEHLQLGDASPLSRWISELTHLISQIQPPPNDEI